MATLSMFYGIIIKMNKEDRVTEEGTYFKVEPLR